MLQLYVHIDMLYSVIYCGNQKGFGLKQCFHFWTECIMLKLRHAYEWVNARITQFQISIHFLVKLAGITSTKYYTQFP